MAQGFSSDLRLSHSVSLTTLETALHNLFKPADFGPDSVFSKWIPKIYEQSGVNWRALFEPEFCALFNGTMIRGAPQARHIFLASFPSAEILGQFCNRAQKGDVLICHHALDYQSGASDTQLGVGFVELPSQYVTQMVKKGLTLFSMHAPLDYSPIISTTGSIVTALEGRPVGQFCGKTPHFAGSVCEIPPQGAEDFLRKISELFTVNRLDLFGNMPSKISRVAIVAGEATSSQFFQQAESLGAEVYLAGEVRSYVEGDWGMEQRRCFDRYITDSSMCFVGVSHGASESLVMERELGEWLKQRFLVPITVLHEANYWR